MGRTFQAKGQLWKGLRRERGLAMIRLELQAKV